LSMFMHNGWFFTLGAASSFSVCCRATTMMLTRASFRNLHKVFSISRSTYTWLWLVERVTYINCQENSKETNHIRDKKTMQIVRKSNARKLKLPKNPKKKWNLASIG
jgi:hypothetical protein